MEFLLDLTTAQQILLVLAIFFGIVQTALLTSMALNGGTVTIWYGVLSVACVVAVILL